MNVNPKDVDKGWKETNFMSVWIPKCTTMSELYIATEVQPVEEERCAQYKQEQRIPSANPRFLHAPQHPAEDEWVLAHE